MFCLSQTTGYAIRALACLHECGGGLMQAKDVAACTGIPLPYLSKLLHTLGHCGLIDGKRGYRGGFALTRPPRELSFYDIAVAVEGEGFLPQCMLGPGICPDHGQCPGQAFWKTQRRRIARHLQRMTLADVQQTCAGRAAPCAVTVAIADRSATKTTHPRRTRQRSRS